MAKERVAVFIDGSNFYHALKQRFKRASLDFARLVRVLVGKRELVRAYYYNAPYDRKHPKAREQQQFFDMLRKTPYLELQLGRLQPKRGTTVQKGVDVKLAVQMIDFAYHDTYDTAILVSGDSDFVPAVQFVKDLGKHVELAVVEGQPCFHLEGACDRLIIVDNAFLKSCWVRQEKS